LTACAAVDHGHRHFVKFEQVCAQLGRPTVFTIVQVIPQAIDRINGAE
jgi:hypothetical protein